MAAKSAVDTNAQQELAAQIANLRERAQAGDPEAAMELASLTKKRGVNSEYKWDRRTEVADGVDGSQYGVVTWEPNDSDEKYHYVIHVLTDGTAEIVHSKSTGKPFTLDKPSSMKTFINAMRGAGVIA